MLCPKCSMRTFVKETRDARNATIRICECCECGYCFMTSECFLRVEKKEKERSVPLADR